MDILVISNINEHKGLYRDALNLATVLDELGCDTMIVDFRDGLYPQADLCIHLEVVYPKFFDCSSKNWWVPNAEWCREEYMVHIDCFDKVLYKTRDAERLLTPYTPRGVFTGFVCEDKYDPEIPREKVFFHAGGGSIAKGTEAIQEAWTKLKYPLVMAKELTDAEMAYQQNRCIFQMTPSSYEGWGVVLHEGLACGQVVITTDTPPMSEMDGIGKLIKPSTVGKQCLARTGQVNPVDIRAAAKACWEMTDREIEYKSQLARNAYLCEVQAFKTKLAQLLKE